MTPQTSVKIISCDVMSMAIHTTTGEVFIKLILPSVLNKKSMNIYHKGDILNWLTWYRLSSVIMVDCILERMIIQSLNGP